jgi:hypothetical protein
MANKKARTEELAVKDDFVVVVLYTHFVCVGGGGNGTTDPTGSVGLNLDLTVRSQKGFAILAR